MSAGAIMIEKRTIDENKLFRAIGPQLGEILWHTTHLDPHVHTMSKLHGDAMISLIEKHALNLNLSRPLRILEVGAYCHYGAHLAAAQFGGVAVAHDIAPHSLELGLQLGRDLKPAPLESHAFVGDFHELPFSDGYFDLVFIASAVHHTYSPRKVIGEMFRVVRSGGIVHLENEPLARSFATYTFRCSRAGSYTPLEQALNDAQLLWIVSSPYPGSRAETLFSMVENERIPLALYRHALEQRGDIVDWQVNCDVRLGDLEREMLAFPVNDDLETNIGDWLLDKLSPLRPHVTQWETDSGRRLPNVDEVWELAYRVGELRRQLALEPANESLIGKLFGGALKCTARKTSASAQSDILLTRHVELRGAVHYDDYVTARQGVNLKNLFPEGDEERHIAAFFPASDWVVLREEGGVSSLANLGSSARVITTHFANQVLCLFRIYSVQAAEIYWIDFLRNGQVIYSHCVATSESHLARFVCAPGDDIEIRHRNRDGDLLNLAMHLRMIVRAYSIA
jgi:ubiquinone/menaquinone biosynthesis C-methylase UbiE